MPNDVWLVSPPMPTSGFATPLSNVGMGRWIRILTLVFGSTYAFSSCMSIGFPLFLCSKSGPVMEYTMFSRRVYRRMSGDPCGSRSTLPRSLLVEYADAYLAAASRFAIGKACFDMAPNTVERLTRSAASSAAYLSSPASVLYDGLLRMIASTMFVPSSIRTVYP